MHYHQPRKPLNPPRTLTPKNPGTNSKQAVLPEPAAARPFRPPAHALGGADASGEWLKVEAGRAA